MYKRELLRILRTSPASGEGLQYLGGAVEDSYIYSGLVRDPASGKEYSIENGYLDLLGRKVGADNIANLTNLLPGAGPLYEPLWRTRSLTLLTGEHFSNEIELEVVSGVVGLERGGLYLDIGCSAGLYTRGLAARLGDLGSVVGIDISPSMLGEAARRAKKIGTRISLVRADAARPPFADASFAGAVCGGTLNELGEPARVLRETWRVLEPGGRISIMGILKARSTRGRYLQRLLQTGGVRFFEPEEVQSMLAHAGFKPDPLETKGAIFFAGATRR